jgi:hypothetical protein
MVHRRQASAAAAASVEALSPAAPWPSSKEEVFRLRSPNFSCSRCGAASTSGKCAPTHRTPRKKVLSSRGMAKVSLGEGLAPMKRALIFWAALHLALFSATIAHAADVTVLDRGSGDIPAVISINGFIEMGDDKKFIDITTGIRKAIVFLESPGGRISPAMAIGIEIRKHDFGTTVPQGKVCTSACALTWLAGTPRYMGKDAKVGFHAAKVKQEDTEPSAPGNASVGYYMHELKFPLQAVIFVTETSPDNMAWLSQEDAQTYGIPYYALAKAQADRFAALTPFHLKRRPVPAERAAQTWRPSDPSWLSRSTTTGASPRPNCTEEHPCCALSNGERLCIWDSF